MSNPAINVSQLSFSYSQTTVLNDVSFSVNEGEYLSIIGPNGSGKSTLLKCLNRIVSADFSKIRIFGRELSSFSQKELAKLVGYVPQHHGLITAYTVEEFVMMGRYPYLDPLRSYSSEDKKIVDDILHLTGLEEFKSRMMHQLSGGERQKVYIASSLAQQPKILLLDEPTIHLDPQHNIEVQKLISKICCEYRMTIIHVTHDLTHIQSWSQKLIALKKGKIVFSGIPQEILTAKNLEQVFEVPFQFFNDRESSQTIIIPRISEAK